MMTGWEHDVPDDDSALRQWVLTNLTRYRTIIERIDGRIDVLRTPPALFDAASARGVRQRRGVAPSRVDRRAGRDHRHRGCLLPARAPVAAAQRVAVA